MNAFDYNMIILAQQDAEAKRNTKPLGHAKVLGHANTPINNRQSCLHRDRSNHQAMPKY